MSNDTATIIAFRLPVSSRYLHETNTRKIAYKGKPVYLRGDAGAILVTELGYTETQGNGGSYHSF